MYLDQAKYFVSLKGIARVRKLTVSMKLDVVVSHIFKTLINDGSVTIA